MPSLSDEEILIRDMAAFATDPLAFVMYAFPWGEGILQDHKGPEQWQREVLCAVRDGLSINVALQLAVASGHGVGKALLDDDYVPSPSGRIKVSDVAVGDFIFGEHGQKVKVLGIRRYNDIPFYRVTFSDKSSVDVSSGHLWKVKNRQDRRADKDWQILSTEDILKIGVKRPNGVSMSNQWEIPQQAAVNYPKRNHPVDPYTYAVWLGDGDKRSGRITNVDKEVWDNVAYKHKEDGLSRTLYGLKADMVNAGLHGCTTYNACVNREYIESSERLSVLQGLLDTDGWVENSGGAAFGSASKQLAQDVVELSRSLGLVAREIKFKKNKCAGAWYTHITWDGKTTLFRIKRKQERLVHAEERYQKRWINKIEPVSIANGTCFEVEGGLFLTRDFHVTHNSAIVSWLTLWALCTHENTRGVVTANTETQLRTKTWPELVKWHNLLICKHWFVCTATSIYSAQKDNEKTWRVDAIPWSENNTEAFAGLHNKGNRILVIMDEASAIPDVIWEVCEGALTDTNTEIIWAAFGNPTRNTGRFWQCFNGLRHRWKVWRVDSRHVSLSNKQKISEWVTDYGEDSDFVRVRVKGDFPRTSEGQFIPMDIITPARGRHLRADQYNWAPVIIGVDPQWSGSDEGVIYLRQGLMSKLLMTYRQTMDDFTIAGALARFEDEERADAVFIDLGYGTGIFSAGKQMSRSWQLVPFGGKSSNEGYINKRAEMWALMKEWLKEGGALPDDPIICDELAGPFGFVTQKGPNTGKIFLESKDDMKERGLSSPNRADALCLTFAAPVMSKSQKQFERLSSATPSKYDPFNHGPGAQKKEEYNPLSQLSDSSAMDWKTLISKKD